jgi:tRNA (cmo5U34)-methyltransferase
MTNEWARAEHALDYLRRLEDIPHRQEGEATLISEIPKHAKCILDLGCGNGHLLALLLAHCDKASGVGLDFSPTMLSEAERRFARQPRVKLVMHNLDAPLPNLGTFDVIVSSFAIHHCIDERKRAIYREVWNLLEPGGVFCNLEHVASPNAEVHKRFLQSMNIRSEEEDPSNKLLDVETQLRWLRDIGYEDVDCYWKWRELALLIGRKPA